jgi:hypothetical protein
MAIAAWLSGEVGIMTPSRADDPVRPSIESGREALSEGDRLADADKPNDAQLSYQRAFEAILPVMRGLDFKQSVKHDITKREKLRDRLLQELDEDRTPEELRGEALSLVAFGLWPSDLDYKETMVRVYTEEIAAFYDPKSKTMHMIQESETKAPERPKGLLDFLNPKPAGFDKDGHKTVIAHELTHALADQHYDIDRMQKGAKGDDDRTLALTALIEGEAMLTMLAAQSEDYRGTRVIEIPARDLDRTFSLLAPFMPAMSGQAVRKAPPILSQGMIFPYLKGLVFCAHLGNGSGWSAIDAAYRDPPISTEQILHPERYLGDRDAPVKIELGEFDDIGDWKCVYQNVMGEFQTGVLLRRFGGRAAAAGWDGDEYAALRSPGGRLALVWRTTWDTEDDAREFFRSYARYQADRHHLDDPFADVAEPDAVVSVRREHTGAQFEIACRGKDVSVVEGFAPEVSARLLERAFAAPAREKSSTGGAAR